MKMEIAGPARKVSTHLSDCEASRSRGEQSWVRHAASPLATEIWKTSTKVTTRKSEFHCSCGFPHCRSTLLGAWGGGRENEDIMLLYSNKHGGRSQCTECSSTEVQPSKHSTGTSWKLRLQTEYTFKGLEIEEWAVNSMTERHEIGERSRLKFY
jgi:hypothetical protein